MTDSTGSDPIELLRASDPVDPDRVPSANLARVRASVQETVMTDLAHGTDRRANNPERRKAIGFIGAVVASAAVLGAIAFSSFGSDQVAQPTPSDDGAGGGMAMCIRFDLETLARAEVAFDGTVTAVDGDNVTFAVAHWYRGPGGDSITLTEPGLGDDGITLGGTLLDFEVGGRYLVSGSDGVITTCGFSVPYTDADAADWATAFGN